MRCGICGSEGGKPYELQSGRIIGDACERDLCGALLWESVAMPPESKVERLWLAWRIRKQQAEVAGRVFNESLPVEAEILAAKWDRLATLAGMTDEGEAA